MKNENSGHSQDNNRKMEDAKHHPKAVDNIKPVKMDNRKEIHELNTNHFTNRAPENKQ